MPSPRHSNDCSSVYRLRAERHSARTLFAALAIGALLICTSPRGVNAQASPSLAASMRSLRHVTFAFDLSVNQTTETKMEGINGTSSATSHMSGINSRDGIDRHETGRGSKGTIDFDVLGAGKDGELYADISEASSDRAYPAARVQIAFDGSVSYLATSTVPLTYEETLLLRFLSRGGVLGGTARAAGDSWSIPNSAGDYSATATYRLMKATSEHELQLALDLVEKVAGPAGYDAHTSGTLAYDSKVLVPLSARLVGLSRTSSPQTTVTTDDHLDISRVSDTFAPAATVSPAPAASPLSPTSTNAGLPNGEVPGIIHGTKAP